MGNIAKIAAMQTMNRPAGGGTSGVGPMVKEYNKKKNRRQKAQSERAIRSIGTNSGICDNENDWLSRQLKEEDAIQRRMVDEYGLRHFKSDAHKLKAEHAVEHAWERYNGLRR